MNPLLLSGSCPSHAAIRDLTEPNHTQAAEAVGFDYLHAEFPEGEGSWPKLDFIREELSHRPEVIWVDSDVIFLPGGRWTPITYLRQSAKPISISVDCNGPCAGIMAFLQDPMSLTFLAACSAHRFLFADHPWMDQAAVRSFAKEPPFRDHIHYFHWSANDYRLYPGYAHLINTPFQKTEDFPILHVAGLSLEEKITIIQSLL